MRKQANTSNNGGGQGGRVMPHQSNDQQPMTQAQMDALARDIDGEGDDTMNNLRKTFAGIFGGMQKLTVRCQKSLLLSVLSNCKDYYLQLRVF